MTAPRPQPMVRKSDTPMYVATSNGDLAQPGDRNTIGGWPVLPAQEPWPLCFCGERMVLFFQFDIPSDIAAFGGDHVLVFQCPAHNDAVVTEGALERLPERFWDNPPPLYTAPGAFWRIMLHRDDTVPAVNADPYLLPRVLNIQPTTEHVTLWHPDEGLADEGDTDQAFADRGVGRREFKIGGVPSWAQERESYTCCCGAELVYVCQVPEDTGFDKQPHQPEQLDTFNSNKYGLFLGNENYILACPAHCHPAAAWPVNQN